MSGGDEKRGEETNWFGRLCWKVCYEDEILSMCMGEEGMEG